MTLAFSWATNANYSTGPDTGTATKIDPASTANGFVNGTIAAAQHINFLFDAVGDELAKAVDGIGGGTYNLGANLTFQSTGEVRFANVARITSGGSFVADGSCTFNQTSIFNATLTVASGITLDCDGQLVVSATGDIVAQSGATIQLEDSEDLIVNANTENWILTMAPHSQSFDAGTLAPTWLPLPSAAGWFQHEVGSAVQICFPITLPPGDSIVTCVVRANGAGAGAGHASLPAGSDRLLVKIIRVEFDGAVTVEASRADQSANVGAYDISHVITLASGSLDSGALPITVNATDRYYVVIEGEKGANAVADTTTITEVKGTCTARSYRANTMVY